MSLYQPVDLTPLHKTFSPFTIDLDETESSENETVLADSFKSPELLSELASLSLNPEGTSKWLTVLKHDTIKERNKAKAPPKVLKAAPFFIPTVAGLEFQLDTSEVKKLLKHEKKTDIVAKVLNEDSSVLVQMMKRNDGDVKAKDIIGFLEVCFSLN